MMKKIFLLTILLFQLTFVLGQENKWGPWNNSDCYPKIQFRAKLVSKQYYNGGSTSSDGCNSGQGYQWKVQVRNNYSKTVWVNFSGGNKACVEKNVHDGNGLNLDPGEVGEISLKDWYSNNTKDIYVLIKAMAFLDSKNDDRYKNNPALQYEKCDNGGLCQICRMNISANHCPEAEISKKVKMNDNGTSNSLSIEDLENIIVANLKRNLKNGTYYDGNYCECEASYSQINPTKKPSVDYFSESDPNTLYIYFYYPGQSNFFIEKFVNLKIEKKTSRGVNLIYFVNNEKNPNWGLFLYDFGDNDENLIELQNAIEALKNPNKNSRNSNNQITNVKTATVVKENASETKFTIAELLKKGKEYQDKQDFQTSLKFFEEAAENGNPEAMEACGFFYIGWNPNVYNDIKTNINIDVPKAIKWFEQAALKGKTTSMIRLAHLYRYRLTEAKYLDLQKAKEWYKKACDAGEKGACDEYNNIK